jgi:phosphoglycolate phosphatase
MSRRDLSSRVAGLGTQGLFKTSRTEGCLMKLESVKAVIFDLDHTLVKSAVDFMEMRTGIIEHLEKRFPSFGKFDKSKPTYEITQAAVLKLQEQGLTQMIPEILAEINGIMNDVEMKYASRATLIEGAKETLAKLKRAGFKVGILTRGCRQYTEEVLKTNDLSELVDEVAARDDSLNPKPDPAQVYWLIKRMKVNAEEVVMVGDHPVDALCAGNAGIRFVGVLTGSWRREQIEQLGPVVIPSVKELPDLLGI